MGGGGKKSWCHSFSLPSMKEGKQHERTSSHAERTFLPSFTGISLPPSLGSHATLVPCILSVVVHVFFILHLTNPILFKFCSCYSCLTLQLRRQTKVKWCLQIRTSQFRLSQEFKVHSRHSHKLPLQSTYTSLV